MSAKAAGSTLVAILLFGSPAWRDSLRTDGLGPTFAISLSMATVVGVIVFLARLLGIYRTGDEWDRLKASGHYSKADESRRAVYTFALGIVAIVAALGLFALAESALR